MIHWGFINIKISVITLYTQKLKHNCNHQMP